MNKLNHCCYVLYSLKDNLLYIGYSSDLEKRLIDHSKGSTKSTSPRRPFILLLSEFYYSKDDAKRREKYFKTTPGKRALRLMLRNSLKELK